MRRTLSRREHLVDAYVAGLERERATEHVKPPRSLTLGTNLGDHLGSARGHVGNPATECQGVVLAERLRVADLQARALHRLDDLGDGVQLAVGKHIASDERLGGARPRADLRDPVVEKQPARPKEPGNRVRIAAKLVATDVLVHADACDLVVGPVCDLAVVLDPDRDAVLEPQALDSFSRAPRLRLR